MGVASEASKDAKGGKPVSPLDGTSLITSDCPQRSSTTKSSQWKVF